MQDLPIYVKDMTNVWLSSLYLGYYQILIVGFWGIERKEKTQDEISKGGW